jgi:hypothetical protein
MRVSRVDKRPTSSENVIFDTAFSISEGDFIEP